MKKYCFTDETMVKGGRTLHRIKALVDIPKYNVKVGDLGGFIEKEENLSHDGAAWVLTDAVVFGHACVYEDAAVCGKVYIEFCAKSI